MVRLGQVSMYLKKSHVYYYNFCIHSIFSTLYITEISYVVSPRLLFLRCFWFKQLLKYMFAGTTQRYFELNRLESVTLQYESSTEGRDSDPMQHKCTDSMRRHSTEGRHSDPMQHKCTG